jgi:hypothetical protein
MTIAQNPIDIATTVAVNGVDSGHSNNTKAVAATVNGTSKDARNWIPIAEHVLLEPQRKVKIISIGCGFSGQ